MTSLRCSLGQVIRGKETPPLVLPASRARAREQIAHLAGSVEDVEPEQLQRAVTILKRRKTELSRLRNAMDTHLGTSPPSRTSGCTVSLSPHHLTLPPKQTI